MNTALVRVFLASLIFAGCVTNHPAKAAPAYKYDEALKKCLNTHGQRGLNPFNPSVIFDEVNAQDRRVIVRYRNAQCIDFSNVALDEYIGVGYKVLEKWDFRGANFSNATFYFNFIKDSLFEGANLENFEIGYARIRASDIPFNKGDMPFPNTTDW